MGRHVTLKQVLTCTRNIRKFIEEAKTVNPEDPETLYLDHIKCTEIIKDLTVILSFINYPDNKGSPTIVQDIKLNKDYFNILHDICNVFLPELTSIQELVFECRQFNVSFKYALLSTTESVERYANALFGIEEVSKLNLKVDQQISIIRDLIISSLYNNDLSSARHYLTALETKYIEKVEYDT